jgi:hypothetical protein
VCVYDKVVAEFCISGQRNKYDKISRIDYILDFSIDFDVISIFFDIQLENFLAQN